MTTSVSKPFQLHSQLIESIHYTKSGFLVIGQLLSELKDEDRFRKAVGEGIDTWDDYISQPEISLSRGEANRLIQIYETFILKLGLPEGEVAKIPIKNLHYLLPIAKQAKKLKDVEELVQSAGELTQRDFRERIFEEKNENPEHTYTYLVMRRCNETSNLSRVQGITSEQIVNAFNIDETI